MHVQRSGEQQQQLRLLSSCKVLGPVGTQHVFLLYFTTVTTVFLNNVVSQEEGVVQGHTPHTRSRVLTNTRRFAG